MKRLIVYWYLKIKKGTKQNIARAGVGFEPTKTNSLHLKAASALDRSAIRLTMRIVWRKTNNIF